MSQGETRRHTWISNYWGGEISPNRIHKPRAKSYVTSRGGTGLEEVHDFPCPISRFIYVPGDSKTVGTKISRHCLAYISGVF
jgi:hypothetical protein